MRFNRYKMEDALECIIDYRGKTPEKSDKGIMTLSAKSVRDGFIDYSQCYCISEDEYKRFMVRGFPKVGDVLLTTEAPLGTTAILDRDDVALAQRLLALRGKVNVLDTRFLYYWLKSSTGQRKLQERQTGTTVTGIKQAEFRKIEIDLPEISIQGKIASVLTSIDNKIKLNNQINDNLEQQAFALFDSVFPTVTSGNKSIGDYITPKRGKNLLSKYAIFGTVPVVAGGLEPSTYHNISNTVAPVLTISASGANSGYVQLWNIPVWSSDSSYIDSTMTKHVYFWYVMLKKRQKEIYDSQTGSAQPHIYPQHIAVMPMLELSEVKVERYIEQVAPLFRMIGVNKAENERLATTRDMLLPKLMTGELNVSDIDL